MNATENEAAQKALDSLLNYETVKVFCFKMRFLSVFSILIMNIMKQHDMIVFLNNMIKLQSNRKQVFPC